MKKVEAFKCDFCSKASINAGAMAQHEKFCPNNPNNKQICWQCKHFVDSDGKSNSMRRFTCNIDGRNLYSFKLDFMPYNVTKNMRRMPCTCDAFEPYTFDFWNFKEAEL